MITLAEAKTIVNPYLGMIGWCITNAIRDYQDNSPKQLATHSRRTRASAISDWIKYHIQKDMNDIKGVHCFLRYGQVRIIIEDKLQLAFKKLDKNCRPSYARTKRAIRFFEAQGTGQLEFPDVQLELPDVLHPRRNLVAGYQWNDLLPANVYIVCPHVPPTEWRLDALETLPPAVVAKDEEVKPTKERKVVKPKGEIEKSRRQARRKGNEKGDKQ